MKVIQAPNEYYITGSEIPCFMAGGLQKCDWHNEFLDMLSDLDPHHLVVYNPKRSSFDMSDPKEAERQIKWEFKFLNMYLDRPYIFSMYFDDSESSQPICFYELGRYMALLSPYFEHAVISSHPKFSRSLDVLVQVGLVTEDPNFVKLCSPEEHAKRVYKAYRSIKERMK